MAIRTLVVDDEKPARLRMRSLLQKIPEIELVGEAENGEIALEFINRAHPDLVFLDIQMPILNGFQVLERMTYTPEIVFVTAWDRYAIRAFEVNAVDYLLKPYSSDRLLRAIEKATRALRDNVDRRAQILAVLERYRESETRLQRITVRKNDEFFVIEVEAVDFFRAEDGLVFLHAGAERYLADKTLQDLEQSLDPSVFYRIHRGAIVNLNRIETVSPAGNGKFEIESANYEKLIVSRDRARKFKSLTGFSGSRRRHSE